MGLHSTLPHKSTHSTSGADPLTPTQIGAATAAQGAKADTASQPGHTHTISNIIDFGGVTNFQPSPEYLSDEVSGITVTSSIGANDNLQKTADYWASGDWAVTKNGPSGTWLLEFIGDGSPASVASTNATQFPWQATWPTGTIVVKTPVARIVGTSLASMASEGTSSYQARADHVHPLPSALQVGAAPLQSGKIPSQYLPSYVDDVMEYETLSALQADTAARESGKIFVVRNTGKIYRWSGGTLFIEISNTLELGDLQMPDAQASVIVSVPNFSVFTIPLTGTKSGKRCYSGENSNDHYEVFWTGTNWKATGHYSADGESYGESIATGNTQYPWQATGWTNGGSVTRAGTYNANLDPSPLAADAYSGVATKAARADHVHPWPTPEQISAATAAQGAKADTASQPGHQHNATEVTTAAVKVIGLINGDNGVFYPNGFYNERQKYTCEPDYTLWFDDTNNCWRISSGLFHLEENFIANSDLGNAAPLPHLAPWDNDVYIATLEELCVDFPNAYIGQSYVQRALRMLSPGDIGAATAAQGAKADTALQPTTTPLIPLLFGHSSYSYAAGGQTRFFSQIFDLSVAASSTARNFRFLANITIKGAIFTVYNGGANTAAGHSGATLRLRNKNAGTSRDILSYNLNGLATEGSLSWRVPDLSIGIFPTDDYVIEMETGTFSVAPTSVRQTLALYYL